jgi:ABC-2 type transport system ATP-binding protein
MAWEAIDRAGLRDAAQRKIAGYSKGMRQRIKLAQAISHKPKVLILDEPLNGLDPLARAETIALFRELGSEGSHVLISSHILHEVDLISDQVVMMSQGYVVAEGQIRGVRDEISDQPMQILIRCDKPEYLASQLFDKEQVVEAKLHADRAGLLVRTRNAESFYKLLNHIAVNGIRIESVAPADDDAQSVYEYLIGAQEGQTK